MRLIRLTAFSFIFFTTVLSFSSCEKESESKKGVLNQKTGIVMSGAQVVPASTSAALGSLDVTYTKGTKNLGYKFSWSGLSGVPTGIGVYGLAPVGYTVSPTTPFQTISITGLGVSGSYSGTMLIDGVVAKEENLLAGLYYILIRTAANPAGEIRGQIKFE
jgi:hypothetical protein